MNGHKKPQVYTFIVGGTIGAGKTELIKQLTRVFADKQAFPRLRFFSVIEPVEVWEKSHLLELFIDDPQELGAMFQLTTFSTRLAAWLHLYKTQIKPLLSDDSVDFILVALERSHYCDKHMFASMLLEDPKIPAEEREAYRILFDTFKNKAPPTPISSMVWVNTAFGETLSRKNIRQRPCEDNYDNSYLKKLWMRHEKLLGSGHYELTENTKVPVLKFDGDSKFNTDTTLVLALAHQLVSVAKNTGEITGLKYQDKTTSCPN